MQHALQFMREGTDSSQESRCRIALIRNGLPCPKVNWKVRLNNGKIALLDMAYPDIKVAIEYDGKITFKRSITIYGFKLNVRTNQKTCIRNYSNY